MSARPRIGSRWTALVGAGALALAAPAFGLETDTLRHVHGLGYSPDGNRLMIPSHDGLAVYSDVRWSKALGPEHDFMGFAVTRDFIIRSGHPARGAGRANPLGLIPSRDGGRSWNRLGFEGEAEFHVVAAGDANNAVYVHNPAPNSRMPHSGIYRMIGPGARLARGQRAGPARRAPRARGASDAGGLGCRGDQRGPVPVARRRRRVQAGDGRRACHGCALCARGRFTLVQRARPQAQHVSRSNRGDAREETALPPLERDAMANIAQNPACRAEFAIVTFERAVILTPDAGTTWTRIAPQRGLVPERRERPGPGAA